MYQFTDEVKAAIQDMHSNDQNTAISASRDVLGYVDAEIYKAVVLDGAVADGVFFSYDVPANGRLEFPLGLLHPGNESSHTPADFKAYDVSPTGDLVERMTMGSTLTIRATHYANAVRWPLDILETAGYNAFQNYMELLAYGVLDRDNDLAMKAILTAAKGRGSITYDPAAALGAITPALLSLLQYEIAKQGGGNATSRNRRKLTDVLIGSGGLAKMRNWGLNDVPEQIRYAIWTAQSGTVAFSGLNFHPIDELDQGGEYYQYWIDLTGTDFATGGGHTDADVLIGLDLSNKSRSFINPIVKRFASELETDSSLRRRNLAGAFGRGSNAFAVLDDRYTKAATF